LTETALEMLEEIRSAHGDTGNSTVIERAIKAYHVRDDLVEQMRRRRATPRGKS
jgi:hypothetical protein